MTTEISTGFGAGTRRDAPAQLPMRILILSADVGEGHTAAARALAHDLRAEDPGAEVLVRDGLRALGFSLQRLIRDGYRVQLRRMPWTYSLVYFLFSHVLVLREIGRAVLALLGSRPLLALVRFYEPDVVVSTHPAITSVLGHLRRQRRLDVPACATITDLADYKLWAHPGIDLHLVMHEDGIKPVESVAGEGSVHRVRPLVAPAFLQQVPQHQARGALGLPESGPLIVVSGGGWGVGNLDAATRASLAIDSATVVCIAGYNEEERRRLADTYADQERVVVLGFTERMGELLAAADCLVHSTGGVTSLEALACGCPLVAYGGLGGHARVHNRTMLRLGLAKFAQTPAELTQVLEDVLSRPRAQTLTQPDGAPEPASLVLAATPRVRPLPKWQPTAIRMTATFAVTALIAAWGLSTDDLYPVAARALPIRPVTNVHTRRPEVGLVINAPQAAIPAVAAHLKQTDDRASFAVSQTPTPSTDAALQSSGSRAIPSASSQGGLYGSLRSRKQLQGQAAALGLHKHFYYLMPRKGYTLGEYVTSRAMGASPVAGAVKIAPAGPVKRLDSLRAGQVVVLNLSGDSPAELARLDDLLARVGQNGLSAAPIDELGGSQPPVPVESAQGQPVQAPGQPARASS